MNTAIKSNTKIILATIVIAALALATFAFATPARAQALTGTVTSTSTATTTASTTDMENLRNRVSQLEHLLAMLQNELSALKVQFQNFINNGGGTGTTTPPGGGGTGTTTSSVKIYPETANVRAGTSIDLNGRGFWADEQITIMRGSETLGSARADGGGNFSTGSLPVPRTSGSHTYSLKGDWSGFVGTSVIHVTQ